MSLAELMNALQEAGDAENTVYQGVAGLKSRASSGLPTLGNCWCRCRSHWAADRFRRLRRFAEPCYSAYAMRYLTLFMLISAFAFAQPQSDAKGCKDSAVLSRLNGCFITQCTLNDYNVHAMPIEKGNKVQNVEGAYEKIAFRCPAGTSSIQSYRNAENALKAKGYQILFVNNYGDSSRFTFTARQGPQWITFYSDRLDYQLITVKEKQLEQQMQANTAAGWGEQINQSGRATIYGINFETGKATIKPESEPVLKELLGLLQKQPDWSLLVAGHTDNAGTDALNAPLSQQRAEAVVAWLTAKGVDRSRLVPAGFGSKKPLADNGTEDGRAKNRRVDLVKVY
jgi:OOP family OmpA-OmpF porin